MLWHAQQLAEAGFGVLLYDERASGLSAGSQRSYGWQDPADVVAALDFLQGRPASQTNSYGIAGCSIGGQIALQAAARDKRLAAVWADGPAVVRAADLPPPNNGLSLLSNISSHMLDWFMAAQLKMLPPPALVNQLPQLAGRPIQFVSGGTSINALGPESLLTARFLEAAGPQAQMWVITDAVHCDGPVIAPEAYSARLQRFFLNTLIQ
jgi:pimeloyl-ACP methyl ester carboxylesterase